MVCMHQSEEGEEKRWEDPDELDRQMSKLSQANQKLQSEGNQLKLKMEQYQQQIRQLKIIMNQFKQLIKSNQNSLELVRTFTNEQYLIEEYLQPCIVNLKLIIYNANLIKDIIRLN